MFFTVSLQRPATGALKSDFKFSRDICLQCAYFRMPLGTREGNKAILCAMFFRARPHRGEGRTGAGQLACSTGLPHTQLRDARTGNSHKLVLQLDAPTSAFVFYIYGVFLYVTRMRFYSAVWFCIDSSGPIKVYNCARKMCVRSSSILCFIGI